MFLVAFCPVIFIFMIQNSTIMVRPLIDKIPIGMVIVSNVFCLRNVFNGGIVGQAISIHKLLRYVSNINIYIYINVLIYKYIYIYR